MAKTDKPATTPAATPIAAMLKAIEGQAIQEIEPVVLTSESAIDKIVPAFLEAQKAFRAPQRNRTNPFHKSTYATLDECLDCVRAALHENGIVVLQDSETSEERISIRTILLHESGQRLESSWLRLKPVKTDPQAEGSALTYGRRYSLTTFLGIAAEDDDDAHTATDPGQKRTPASSSPAKATPPKPAGNGASKPAPGTAPLTEHHHELGNILMELCDQDTVLAGALLKRVTAFGESKGHDSIKFVSAKAATFLVKDYESKSAASKLILALDELKGLGVDTGGPEG